MRQLELMVYEILLWKRFIRARGNEFQDLFSEIMSQAYPRDFMPCRPWGAAGDKKNDGYLASKRILFQVYGPSEIRIGRTIKKVERDFAGALADWGPRFDTWVLVYNWDEGLPPTILEAILDLRDRHPKKHIETWGFNDILPHFERISVKGMRSMLGGLPIELRHVVSRTKGKLIRPSKSIKLKADISYIEQTHALILQNQTMGARSVVGKMILACLSYYRNHFEYHFEMAVRLRKAIPFEPSNETRIALHHLMNAFEIVLPNGKTELSNKTKVEEAVLHIERARYHIALAGYLSLQHSTYFFLTKCAELTDALEPENSNESPKSAKRRFRANINRLYKRWQRLKDAPMQRLSSSEVIVRSIASMERARDEAIWVEVDCMRIYEQLCHLVTKKTRDRIIFGPEQSSSN